MSHPAECWGTGTALNRQSGSGEIRKFDNGSTRMVSQKTDEESRQENSKRAVSILSEPEFRVVVARERIRADRNRFAIGDPGHRTAGRSFDESRLRVSGAKCCVDDFALPTRPATWRMADRRAATRHAEAGCLESCQRHLRRVSRRPRASELRSLRLSGRSCADQSTQPHQRLEQPLGSLSAQLDSLFVHPTPMVKRALDVLGASLGLIAVSPFLLLDGGTDQAHVARAGLLLAAARRARRPPFSHVQVAFDACRRRTSIKPRCVPIAYKTVRRSRCGTIRGRLGSDGCCGGPAWTNCHNSGTC